MKTTSALDIAASSIAQFDLQTPTGFVPVFEPPKGSFAPVVVAPSVESARALAVAAVLPGPARFWAAVSVEALAALDLPGLPREGWLAAPHQGRLVFIADGTPDRRFAARIAAQRARAAGWTTDVVRAPLGGRWADVRAGRASPPEVDLARVSDLWIPGPDTDPYEDVGPNDSTPAVMGQPAQPTKDRHEEARL